MARTLAMFTDVSLCIGCRACQVACKQWNQLAPEEPEWTGTYQNHAHFTDKSYRLVRFFEETDAKGQMKQWHMMSDVCKHCAQAGCLEACPTGAIYRTEYGTLGSLNAFFLLLGKPSIYGLPAKPKLPQRNVIADSLLAIGSALMVGLGALVAFRDRGGKGDA